MVQMDDKFKYQHEGLKWLYEMELLDDPQLINNLKLNIMDASMFRVKEVEFVMSQSDRKILIWIELGWFNYKFRLRSTLAMIHERLMQLLPNYDFRIVTDRSILELAITKLKKSMTGGTYAVSTTVDSGDDNAEAGRGEDQLRETPDILPDQAEHADDEVQEGDETVESDLQGKSET